RARLRRRQRQHRQREDHRALERQDRQFRRHLLARRLRLVHVLATLACGLRGPLRLLGVAAFVVVRCHLDVSWPLSGDWSATGTVRGLMRRGAVFGRITSRIPPSWFASTRSASIAKGMMTSTAKGP